MFGCGSIHFLLEAKKKSKIEHTHTLSHTHTHAGHTYRNVNNQVNKRIVQSVDGERELYSYLSTRASDWTEARMACDKKA